MTWLTDALKIDAEIVDLQIRLHTLKNQRNSLTPLYRLPHETIERIMSMLQVKEATGDDNHNSNVDWERWRHDVHDVKWVDAMLACRRFRDVALASSSLWSNVDTSHRNNLWTDLCLERSKSHPLHVLGYIIGDIRYQANAPTLALARHARQLKLIIDPLGSHDDRDWVGPVNDMNRSMERLALNLVDMVLSHVIERNGTLLEIFMHKSPEPHLGTSPLELFFPHTIFAAQSVRLSHLVLDDVQFNAVPHMPRLETLVLIRMRDDIKCTQLRKTLCQAPNVNFVQIEAPYLERQVELDTHAETSNVAGHDFEDRDFTPINLPYLSTLNLSGELEDIAEIIQAFPNPTHDFTLELRNSNYTLQNMTAAKRASHLIHLRAAHYLDISSIPPATIAAHRVRLDVMTGTCLRVEIIPLSLQRKDWPSRRLSLRLIDIDPSENILDLIHHAEIITMSVDELSYFSESLCECPQIQTLVCRFDRYIGTDTKKERYIQAFENFLSERAELFQAALKELVINYLSSEDDRIRLLHPSMFTSYENKWKDAGWVSSVSWERILQ